MDILTELLAPVLEWLKDVNWLDVLALFILALSIAICAQKRFTGLLIGIGAPLVLRPLLFLGQKDPILALAFGLLAGAILGFTAQILSPRLRWSNRAETILGGIGGVSFGLCLILALAISLPIGINQLHNPPTITYPAIASLKKPSFIKDSFLDRNLEDSQVIKLGYDTLLYKVFGSDPKKYMHSSVDPDFVQRLNSWLIIGNPWEQRKPDSININ